MIGLWLVVGLMGWPTADEARRTAEQIVAREALQREHPVAEPARLPPMQLDPPRGGRRSPPQAAPRTAERGGDLGPIVLWTVGGLLLVGLVAVIARELGGRGAPARATAAPPRPGAPPPPERTIVDEADALAAAGRFAEAVHALLLRTIEALGRHMPVPRALTSREIEARAGLPDEARVAFADLVAAVELTRFGGRPADAGDYARCVACFDRIRAALGAR